jgi:hypothetical protein
MFERMYVCLEACKSTFPYTCRPLIGLDACFLKGDYGGQLMAAVGKDGNNQIFPIAYAVVEADKKFLAMVYKIASRRPTKYFTKNICIHLRPAEG